MARKTSDKPEGRGQQPALQAGTDNADSAQAESAAAPRDVAQPAGDGTGQAPGEGQVEPPPVPSADQPLTDNQGGADTDELDVERHIFVVTDRTDVLHDDKWYHAGDPIVLNETDAEALFNNGCIKRPKDDAK